MFRHDTGPQAWKEERKLPQLHLPPPVLQRQSLPVLPHPEQLIRQPAGVTGFPPPKVRKKHPCPLPPQGARFPGNRLPLQRLHLRRLPLRWLPLRHLPLWRLPLWQECLLQARTGRSRPLPLRNHPRRAGQQRTRHHPQSLRLLKLQKEGLHFLPLRNHLRRAGQQRTRHHPQSLRLLKLQKEGRHPLPLQVLPHRKRSLPRKKNPAPDPLRGYPLHLPSVPETVRHQGCHTLLLMSMTPRTPNQAPVRILPQTAQGHHPYRPVHLRKQLPAGWPALWQGQMPEARTLVSGGTLCVSFS